jgi:hypothetical protein
MTGYSNRDGFAAMLNNGSYVNMPNEDGNTFTYVFTNLLAGNVAECLGSSSVGVNIYVQIDVKLNSSLVPSYRAKALSSIGQTSITTLTANTYYIIITPGTSSNGSTLNANWASIDSTYEPGKTYSKYSIIQYNGNPINITGYSVNFTTLKTVSPANGRTLKQIAIPLTFDINLIGTATFTLSYTFMMGSINALGGSLTPQAVSNICFPAGTLIKTDQGIIPIERINTAINTIGNKSIKHITQTVTIDKYLICFEKNALNRNVPNKKTVMTKDHKILFNGQLVPAFRFLDFSSDVRKVKYSGETLYNVLLDEAYGIMNVNNLICETLHPDNIIAKLYRSNFTDYHNDNVIVTMNYSLYKRDLPGYKKMINRLQTTF